jgi:hypothetical protein
MAGPQPIDNALSVIDDAHALVVVRVRVWAHAGPDRDAKRINEALRAYVDAVADFVNGDGK